MNEEELRAEVTRLENENKDLQGKIGAFQTSIEEKDKLIKEHENSIKDLKLKNYDLFIQIPKAKAPEPSQESQEESTMSLHDVINNMKGE